MVLKRNLNFVLPYLGKVSLNLRTRLRWTIERDLPHNKLAVSFRSKCRLNTLFRFKYSLENRFLIGIRNVTGKRLKNHKQSAISGRVLQCNCAINCDNFSILATDFNKLKMLIKCNRYFEEGDKVVSIETLLLRWQFYFQYHMIVRFLGHV